MMEMENSSSRSPDSSCPDHSPYSTGLNECTTTTPNSNVLNVQIGSSAENNLAGSSLGIFQHHIAESIIGDALKPISENSSRGLNYRNSWENFSSFPAVGSYWPSSSSVTNNSCPRSNHQSSASLVTSACSVSSTTNGQDSISHSSSSCAPYFSSTCNVLFTETADPSLPRTEHSSVSSSITNASNYSSSASSASDARSFRQRKNNIATRTTCIDSLSSRRNHSAEHHQSSYLPAQHPEKSAENDHKERGFKRKSPVFNTLDCLPSTSSSISSDMPYELPNHKKKKALSSISYLNLDVDDDIQIIEPETSRDFNNRSTALATSLSMPAASDLNRSSSVATLHNPSATLHGSSSNTAKYIVSESDDQNQNSHQIAVVSLNGQVSLNRSLPSEALDDVEQILDIVWGDSVSSIAATAVASSTVETITIPNEDSSSSSIASVHEVPEDNSSSDTDKQPLVTLEKEPDALPSVITIDENPEDDKELLHLKAKQEAENVKEDFKKLLEDELICNICTELLIKPVTLGCSHTFCKFCISEWKAKKNQCPMCRASIATETPCLFMDNFISKAVEQLDPTSVEKRLEIIKMREEQLKSKVVQPPQRLLQSSALHINPLASLNLPPYLMYQNEQSTGPSWQHSRSTLLSQLMDINPTVMPIAHSTPQSANSIPQSAHSMPQRANPVLQLSNSVLRGAHSVRQNTNSLSSALETEMVHLIAHRGLQSVRPEPAHLSHLLPAHLSSNLAQQFPNVTQASSNFAHQRSIPHRSHVPTDRFFFF